MSLKFIQLGYLLICLALIGCKSSLEVKGEATRTRISGEEISDCTEVGQTKCLTTEKLVAKSVAVQQSTSTTTKLCSENGEQDCIVSGKFKSDDSSVEAISIRAGRQLSGVNGTFKFCRNSANLDETYDYGGIGGINGALDFYDTVFDNDPGSTDLPEDAPWGEEFQCNENIWIDKTDDGACDSASDDCVFQNLLTKSYWTEFSPGNANWSLDDEPKENWPCGKDGCSLTGGNVSSGQGGAAPYVDGDKLNWFDAIYACTKLDFGGFQDWRLPTKNEIMQAPVHNIYSTNSTEFGSLTNHIWSSTTDWDVRYGFIGILTGYDSNALKTNLHDFRCVRP